MEIFKIKYKKKLVDKINLRELWYNIYIFNFVISIYIICFGKVCNYFYRLD